MITALVKKRLMGAGVAVAATAMIAMSGALWWQNRALDRANQRVENLSARLTRAVEANKTNLEVILELEKTNTELLDRIRLDAVAAEDAARRAEERAREAARERDEARSQLRDALTSEPSCEELARLDIGAACPAYGERLRDLQRRVGPN